MNQILRFVFSIVIVIALSIQMFGQGAWIQRADFGPNLGVMNPVCFTIGTKGYVCGGVSDGMVPGPRNELWEWDQINNTWSQKANYPTYNSAYAAGFAIGNKGYLVTGYSNSKLFYEWDQGSNTWTQKLDFPGAGRMFAVGFAIGTKGYIGTGASASGLENDFWEWDQISDTWTQKANFGGTPRKQAAGLSVGSIGYIGTGEDADSARSDFWEWNQMSNIWTQQANFAGGKRTSAAMFATGNKCYIGTGNACPGMGWCSQTDFWEWDPVSNTWKQIAGVPGLGREGAAGLTIGTKGYVGMGGSPYNIAFWEYCDTCSGVGINEQNDNIKLFVFPNPTTGKVFFSNSMSSVNVYNLKGELVLSIRDSTISIDLSSYPEGVYFFRINTDKGVITKKVVVQR